MQQDGKIVVAGSVTDGSSNVDLAIARFNPDGTLDDGGMGDTSAGDSFGSTGVVTYSTGFGDTAATGVVLQPDGKIVVGGYGVGDGTGTDMLAARFNPDGTLDDGGSGDLDPADSFGTAGITLYDFDGQGDYGAAIALAPDSSIVLSGAARSSTYGDQFAVLKLTADGAVDTSFGSGGQVIAFYDPSAAFAVAVDGLGRITAAGSWNPGTSSSSSDVVMIRLLPSGAYDTSFGASGILQTDVSGSGSTDWANAIALTSSGGVVAAGYSDDDFMVARYAPGGTATQRLYALQDANFNVTALADASGTIVQRFEYDPYGKSTVLSAGWLGTSDGYDWLYRHQGGRLETATGKYSFRFRDYDPDLGRWMEEDPAGYVDGGNRYLSYDNNPINLQDPNGLVPEGFQGPRPLNSPPPSGAPILTGWDDSPWWYLNHPVNPPDATLAESLKARIRAHYQYKLELDDVRNELIKRAAIDCELGYSTKELVIKDTQHREVNAWWSVFFDSFLNLSLGSFGGDPQSHVFDYVIKSDVNRDDAGMVQFVNPRVRVIYNKHWTFNNARNIPFQAVFGELLGGTAFHIHDEWTETFGNFTAKCPEPSAERLRALRQPASTQPSNPLPSSSMIFDFDIGLGRYSNQGRSGESRFGWYFSGASQPLDENTSNGKGAHAEGGIILRF